jgi:MOSC domain-containing protein YiiM
MMQVISLNIGKSIEVEWKSKLIKTTIYKYPVLGKRKVNFLSIDGDNQTDLVNHGGLDKAVYSYSSEYYEVWKQYIQRDNWNFGLFGENLTTKGLLDNEVKIGNIYKIGTTFLQAIQPRFPCKKLNVRFKMNNMVKLFNELKMNGIYFRVIKEGEIQSGDMIELVSESDYKITILDVVECRATKGNNQEKLNQILKIPFLPQELKNEFEGYLK